MHLPTEAGRPASGHATDGGGQLANDLGDDARRSRHGLPDYNELRRRVREAGLLRRSYGYYLVTSLALLLGFVAVGGMLAFLPGIGDAVAVLAIALLTVQVGFIGHDAGHNQIFQRTWHNRIVGNIAMPLLIGMSFESWTGKHNAHHSHTNEVGSDPDIEHSFLAFTPEQAAERRGLARWVVRHQARLYFVLAMGATIGFRIDAWSHAIHSFRDRTARWEVGLMAVNLVGWLVVPSLLLGPGRWLPIFAVSQLIIGVYMASVFAPNHKGMPLIRGERPGFLQQQVLTSRNVGGGPLVAFFYGGLNFQIEHHLFPNMARNKLAACRKLVREFCAEVGLAYSEESVVESYRSLLHELDLIGRGMASA